MQLSGKVALITGASSGIGAMLAQHLAKENAIPILTARSKQKLDEIASTIRTPHQCYIMDVTNDVQVKEVVTKVIEQYGKIDILINNAGYGIFQKFIETPNENFIEMMDVNYFGTVRCTKAVLPYMLAARQGHIINVISLAGKVGSAKSTAYTATKHAMTGFTKSLRLELSGSGVRISAINPGPIRTPFFDRADPTGNYMKQIEFLMLEPEKVVRSIVNILKSYKAEKNLPSIAKIGIVISDLFPRLFDRFTLKFLNKK